MIVVDTNVWSEATKAAPDPLVREWARNNAKEAWLSVIVLAELRGGAAWMDLGKRRLAFESEFDKLATDFADRLLLFDAETSLFYAKVLERSKRLGKPIGTADAMIAATALQHNMAVATRNLSDFAGAGVELINPWEE